jgi:hypothetical protein
MGQGRSALSANTSFGAQANKKRYYRVLDLLSIPFSLFEQLFVTLLYYKYLRIARGRFQAEYDSMRISLKKSHEGLGIPPRFGESSPFDKRFSSDLFLCTIREQPTMFLL